MIRSQRVLIRSLLTAALVVLALGPADPALAAQPKIVTYTVQEGDSVWSIAQSFYGDGKQYKRIYRYNQFPGKPPHILTAGMVLRLPVGEVGPEAQVDWVKKDVKAKPPRSLDWLKARKDMNLWRLYKVSTGEESAASIQFEDRSNLRVRDNAMLVIYGATASKSKKSKKREKTRIVLEKGTLRGGLSMLDGDTPEPAAGTGGGGDEVIVDQGPPVLRKITVETPSGSVDIFGRDAQVEAEGKSASISVFDGKADVNNRFGKVDVPQNFGTVVKKGKKPQKPRPLPPTPAWTGDIAGDAMVIVRPKGDKGAFEATWSTVERAKFYRVELAKDEKFKRTLVDALVGSGIQKFRAQDLDEGVYYARAASLDKDRLESQPTKPMRVEITQVATSRKLEVIPGGYQTVGMVQLTFANQVGATTEYSVDGGEWRSAAEPLGLSEPGDHKVSFRVKGSKSTSAINVKVLATKAELVLGKPVAERGAEPGETYPIALTVLDELGRPAVIPGMKLESSPGGEIGFTRTGPGQYAASVTTPSGYREMKLRAVWAGGVITESAIKMNTDRPEVVQRPYEYVWNNSVTPFNWERRTHATVMPNMAAETHVGIRAGFVRQEIGGDAVDRLGMVLAGEWAPGEGDLALDAALTLFRPTLSSDSPRLSELGDMRLGVRYRLVNSDALALAPLLRVTLPTAGDDQGTTLWGAEPGVLLRLKLGDQIAFDTRQSLPIGFGDDTHITYDGTYSLLLRPARSVSLSGTFQTAISLSQPDGATSFTALVAGGGVYVHFGRVRLGMAIGAGINDDAKRELGAFNGMLTVDFGYEGP